MRFEEAKQILNNNDYLLEDKSVSDYKTFKNYLKDFKAELLTQYMSPEIGERKYKKIISNKKLLQEIKDNWINGDYSPAEMVEYILDNDLDESYQVAWDDKVRYDELPTETNNTSLMQYEKDIKNFCFKNKINYDGFLSCKDSPFDTLIVKYYEHDIPVDAICRSIMHWISTKHPELLEEDFTMGVGAPLGADQGIPHSMQGCAVPMMRLGEPAPMGKIQKCGSPHPMHRHRPIPFGLYLLGSNVNLLTGKKRKRKKKKRKKK